MRFDQEIDRRKTSCFKYDGLKMIYGRDDLLPMWVADMDFAVSDEIQAALKKRLEHPIYGYNLRGPDFEQAVRNWQMSQHNWDIRDYRVIAVPSVMTALAITILSLSKPGDEILIQTPVYPPFHSSVVEHKRRLLTNPLVNIDGRYQIDWEDFENKIKRARLFILCNPHNPVGRVFTDHELAKMHALCVRHKVTIFSDEIHSDIVYPPHKHIPIAKYGAENVICSLSPAKSFNLAGLATAVMIVKNPDLAKLIAKMNYDLHTFMGNSFGVTALIAAYTSSEAWLKDLKVYLRENRDIVHEYFEEKMPHIKVSKTEGSFLAWLDFRALQIDDEHLMSIIRDKALVALNAGTGFGDDGSGYMRLNFACPRARLLEALGRIEKAIGEST
jgi:cystathionine beta-lyase